MIVSVLVSITLAAYASAHGYLARVSIDGKSYEGIPPRAPARDSIIRQVANEEPVKGADNAAINCGKDAQLASSVADINPGSTITFDWRAADSKGFWPHEVGPMLTYMASCGDQSCSEFHSENAEWFKIAESGLEGGKWKQASLKTGGVDTATIPSDLAPGNYLIRHEIIALHVANSMGGAEFYPNCVQVKVGGNGSRKPTGDDLVKLPGAYHDDDPGIFIFDGLKNYIMPGPKIDILLGEGNSNNDNDSSNGSNDNSNQSGQNNNGNGQDNNNNDNNNNSGQNQNQDGKENEHDPSNTHLVNNDGNSSPNSGVTSGVSGTGSQQGAGNGNSTSSHTCRRRVSRKRSAPTPPKALRAHNRSKFRRAVHVSH
ncbi:glycoside hydrolase family 61 protein [Moniliophthora roreri]|uniref:lytic cellulose monooxygenase (C4-dehydrogenating) n=1 Tax=Moniliophthora roreri TaxID=221103 RepID=A0A0W0EY53_MONRR|nr:glycoside hydrolase family 61 protein [Moniliophthora roreri]